MFAIAFLTGCSGGGLAGIAGSTLAEPAAQVEHGDVAGRCRSFSGDFDELVACTRANGTLSSFRLDGVEWRVRYFVRFLEMPCHEAPTVDEAYVFHAVIDDLTSDPDLDDAQRDAVRYAMSDGMEHCK